MTLQRFAKRWLYLPLAAGLVIAVPGALAVWSHELLLFGSLGPTAALMVQDPGHPAADWYNAVIGHTLAMFAAFGTVWLLGLAGSPSIFEQHAVTWVRVGAAGLSLALTILLEHLARVHHPPAASTTLLIALGSLEPTWHDGAAILVGVAAVTLAAELLKRLRYQSSKGSRFRCRRSSPSMGARPERSSGTDSRPHNADTSGRVDRLHLRGPACRQPAQARRQ